MKTRLIERKVWGLTLIEVLVVIGVVAILAAMLLLVLATAEKKASRIQCINNMKQVGVAFRLWSGDNADRFPMQVSVTNGGTMEFVNGPSVFRHFQVMSNELSTPKVLLCTEESDSRRTKATTFDTTPPRAAEYVPFSGNMNLSYFLGVDATVTNQMMVLSGDRNITLDHTALRPGLHALGTNDLVGWSREMHKDKGNVLLVDGSAHYVSSLELPRLLQDSGVATNRLAIP